MRSFFKIFFATLLALFVFIFLGIFILAGIASRFASAENVETGSKAVLHIDLGQSIPEQTEDNPISAFGSEDEYDFPGIYDMVRLIRFAKSDSSVKGIYLKCNDNANGFAASEELRNALADFKKSGKFIFAYGDGISERAYYVGNVADRIYCNPKGVFEWKGLAMQTVFFNQTLKKLEIQPQIFYAGKYKSFTEPFRQDSMSTPNRIQSLELLSFIYNRLLVNTSAARGIDTATLHAYADSLSIVFASDAVKFRMIDAMKYNDEVQDEIRQRLKIKDTEKINFVPSGKYAKSVNYKAGTGPGRIALIYATGEIVDGKGDRGQIGSETFRGIIRKVRMDENVKAVVVRVNSPGGSALASENIWRELTITRKTKPVIISFGDVAASGGYYISCNADSIFAQPNTITGSIGVFSILPNMEGFLGNKLGLTFDGVKTAKHADLLSVVRPMTDFEKRTMQNTVDTIYQTFLGRVAAGRKLTMPMVDSIGQGRIWAGEKAVRIGLVDKLGSVQDAIDCAARMAKITDYKIKELPEPENLLDMIFGNYRKVTETKALKAELGEEGYNFYRSIKQVKALVGSIQARMPLDFRIN
jgi:protease-4